MNEMQIFRSPDFGEVRTVEENGTVLFCGSDIAKALGYTNPRKAVSDHCRCVTKRYICLTVLLAVARLLHRADLLARDGEDVFCSRHALRPLVDHVLRLLRLRAEVERDDRTVD